LSLLRGADNTRARENLNWRPQYPSWRQGFQHDLGPRSSANSGERTREANYSS
jgi:hypothetical protein